MTTPNEIDTMTPDELRIAVAEGAGWQVYPTERGGYIGKAPNGYVTNVPDFTKYDGALNTALLGLRIDQTIIYVESLANSLGIIIEEMTPLEVFAIATATPEQMCRAYLKAINP